MKAILYLFLLFQFVSLSVFSKTIVIGKLDFTHVNNNLTTTADNFDDDEGTEEEIEGEEIEEEIK